MGVAGEERLVSFLCGLDLGIRLKSRAGNTHQDESIIREEALKNCIDHTYGLS